MKTVFALLADRTPEHITAWPANRQLSAIRSSTSGLIQRRHTPGAISGKHHLTPILKFGKRSPFPAASTEISKTNSYEP